MGHGVASAWGPHLEQVVRVPVGASSGSGGRQKLHAVGNGSIRKLPCALPGCNLVLSPLGAMMSTTGIVVPGTYSTCSSGRWWAWFPRGGARGSGCFRPAPKQTVCLNYFFIGRLWVSGGRVQYGLEEVCEGLGGEPHDACYEQCPRQLPYQVRWYGDLVRGGHLLESQVGGRAHCVRGRVSGAEGLRLCAVHHGCRFNVVHQ